MLVSDHNKGFDMKLLDFPTLQRALPKEGWMLHNL